MSIITLTTDFGYSDEYAGVMKGVILSRAPSATVIDLTHGIPPQDVARAAFILGASYRYFPDGAIHVVVVDPGVGTRRRIILVRAGKAFFLAPDNGVLTPFLCSPLFREAFFVEAEGLYLAPMSNTFHGRDIFAPVAAAMANGTPPESLGPRADPAALVQTVQNGPSPDKTSTLLSGEVLFPDHYGNIITNIDKTDFDRFLASDADKVAVSLCNCHIQGIRASYGDVPLGTLLALFGSRGYLEIAVNGGSAQDLLKARSGAEVMLSLQRQ